MSQAQHTNLNPVSWRDEPEESGSDWTIVVTNNDNGAVTFYHVHSSVLGSQTATRRSEVLQDLFKEKDIVRIQLNGSVALAFPQLLDHIYKGTWKTSRKVSVAAMYVIADSFMNRKLKEEVDSKIGRLSLEKAYQYLSEAYMLRSKALFDRLVVLLKKSNLSLFQEIAISHLFTLNPEAFAIMHKIMYSDDFGFVASSADLSLALTAVLEGRPELMKDTKLLSSLTDSSLMPRVSPYAALFLLRLPSYYPGETMCKTRSSLEQRCFIACEKLEDSIFMDAINPTSRKDESSMMIQRDDLLMHDFNQLPDSVKIKVLQSALKGSRLSKPVESTVKDSLMPSFTAKEWLFPSSTRERFPPRNKGISDRGGSSKAA
mmetsp:Transcript_5/g.14  ORF Transcript_5/g.14 Transcript_5/m.14 type:complete len:373 (+) Transcript_5:116-1234(+)|eukprot:CAMPEP_0172435836 /NCGR_PEP_ID=MMETSP1064-20121228/71403_1 /TAXON_ID=202472 /ORGANISM="Aulacoseira subarctica , Strain CCAP 1002/5" /LENGTH=372 /DNA_ID=CAMNT_0013184199 /DNA_START=44 /DNA_END=1162 /DNA_ORIENTATION=-